MSQTSRDFQVLAKPNGPSCNLDCGYCYYLEKEYLYPDDPHLSMSPEVLEEYIIQHIEASTGEVIRFTWHGGEPTVLGRNYFKDITALQRKHQPVGRFIHNLLVTNGTLLDEEWCRFLRNEKFSVALSLDGPQKYHDHYRKDGEGKPTFHQTMRGFNLLKQHAVPTEIQCVVNAGNVRRPAKVYGFFKEIGANYIVFLPLVEPMPGTKKGVSNRTVPAEAFGEFLCAIFDEWRAKYTGNIKVQIFEEAARSLSGLRHSTCIFREVCGNVPVIEHNGDVYSCEYYVEPAHRLGNINDTPLTKLIDSPAQQAFGRAKRDHLPRNCLPCDVREMCHGECPRNRFIRVPGGGPRLNYLCAAYKRFFTHCKPFFNKT